MSERRGESEHSDQEEEFGLENVISSPDAVKVLESRCVVRARISWLVATWQLSCVIPCRVAL